MLPHTLLLLFLTLSVAHEHGPLVEEELGPTQGPTSLHQPQRAKRLQGIQAVRQLEGQMIKEGGKRQEHEQLKCIDATDGSNIGTTTVGADSVWCKLLEARHHPMCSSPPCSEVSYQSC